ncbi:MAG: HAD family phosphatase [Chlorobi bacterium]|nr:HAD family phosphatase [Chlorobiota bacterium]
MIRNCIFDFGGVLYKIDPGRSVKSFIALSDRKEQFKAAELENILSRSGFNLYESGKISSAEFREFIRKELSVSTDDETIDRAWNLTLVEKYDFADKIIDETKSAFNLVLLSNTNEIHYEFFEPQCRDLFSKFDRCFFSHELKTRKPEAEIFEIILRTMKYEAEETMFIDDSIINIEAAAKLGLATYHINDKNKLVDLFELIRSGS